MPPQIWTQSYGQSRVRLTKVDRGADLHEVTELAVDVELDGDFNAAYAEGDNSLIVPADTMQNTVYAFAAELDVRDLETFAWTLGSHFIENFDHVSHAVVKITERPWQRVASDGRRHPHAFLGTSNERRVCSALLSRSRDADAEPEGAIECGLDGLALLKTAQAGFSGFLRDEFTTLPDSDDRLLAAEVSAKWVYNDTPDDWRAIRERIRAILIREFAARFSPSLQATLFEMASAVLDAEPAVEEVNLTLSDLQQSLVDLSPFGSDNPNVLYATNDQPRGTVSAGVCRERPEDLDDEGEHAHSD